MTVTQRRTKWKAGLIIALAAIFLITLLAVSLSIATDHSAIAEEEKITFGDRKEKGQSYETVSGSLSSLEDYAPGEDGLISKWEQLYYIFFSENATGSYTLTTNFKINYLGWAISGPTLRGNLNGAGYEIWNAAVPANNESVPTNTKDYVGGLCGEISKGKTIENLYYYFTGSITAKKVAAASYLAVGGMVGVNNGKIDSCRINIAGSIETESDTEGMTSYVGGVVGYMTAGRMYQCDYVVSSASINAYTDKESGSSNAKHNIIYAGGIMGKLDGGNVSKCNIKAAGAVMAADNTDKWEEENIVGTILDIFGSITGYEIELKTAYNDKEHIHPAGVVFGGLGNGEISYNEVEASGGAISYGTGGASNGGSIAGGLIGESYGGLLQSNYVKLKCSLSAFIVQELSLTAEVQSWFSERSLDIYAGGVIGKYDGGASDRILNNFFAIETDDSIIESTYGTKSDLGYRCNTGLLCGNGDLMSKLGGNNWLARNLSESDTGRVAGNDAYATNDKLHHLVIFGSGEVKIKGEMSESTMTAEAKPVYSPFYAWMSADELLNGSIGTDQKRKIKTLQSSNANVLFAVFIDTAIESAGELTQLSRDINQIKLDVYQNIGNASNDSKGNPLMYYGGVSSPTLSWLNVELKKDILVRDGTPVIEDFYGTFNGCGHTISYAAGSKIIHEYEKAPDKKDEYSTEEDENKDITDYTEYTTGLFGVIKSGARVVDLNIIFGGSIDESDGISYRRPDKAGDKLKAKRKHKIEGDSREADPNSVYNNTYAMADFSFPAYTTFDEVYFYGLTGDGYNAQRAYNPGYIEVVPYTVDIVVETFYVGILAGKNEGTIQNVEVEATKSAFVTCSADNSIFGTLCGLNVGQINNVKVTLTGKATICGRTSAVAGGMIGVNQAVEGAMFNGLNAYVSGEIKLESIYNFHAVTVTMYQNAKLKDGNSEDSGYSVIGWDSKNDDQEKAVDVYEVKGLMGTSSYRLYGNDSTVVSQSIGTLVGRYDAGQATLNNVAAVSGSKGTFNTVIYQTDSTDSNVGAMIGSLTTSKPTFVNSWAVMSYDEFVKEDALRRRPIATEDADVKTGINLVYVQKTVAIAEVDIASDCPISFTLASQEGMVFSGWYDYTSGDRTVITEGLVNNLFTPTQEKQTTSNQIYVAELLNLQFFSAEDLSVLSASTGEGRGYEGVTFSLGTNITVSGLTPIGTIDHPFLGSLDGNGLAITLESNKPNLDYAGLFGCVGATGTIKNLTVRVTGSLGDASTLYGGAVAAVNYGTIGQDTSTGKVIAEIEGVITANSVGGIVGVNHRIVKNAEVYFRYSTETAYGQIEATSESPKRVYAGGAIGYNQYTIEAVIAKNIIVYYDNMGANAPILSVTANYAAGGVIGENGNGAAAYSLVSVFNYATIFGEDFPGSNGGHSQYRGLIVGYNSSKNNTDSLWALCLSKSETSDVYYDPKLGAPLSVYQGSDAAVTTGKAVLMSGEDHATANILIKYGWGVVTVSISGAESVKGGQITFLASKLPLLDKNGDDIPEAKRVAFYDYVASFEHGTRVPVSEGNTGFTFSPTVGSASTAGLGGKVYYAGFCNTTIASQADYMAVAANIQNDYRLYVEYNITNNFIIDESSTTPIGTAEKPFIGSVNGNAYTVTMSSASSLHPFVGVLGSAEDAQHSSRIKNLYVDVRSGNSSVSAGEVARGILTDVNYGTVSGVNIALHGYLKTGGSAGAVAGINYGRIDSAVVTVEYAKAFGRNGFGAIVGKNVGGIAGENYGEIGGAMANSVEVTVTREGDYFGVLYASESVGAVAGVNKAGGVIRSAFVSISGTIAGKYASALVGTNEGRVESAFVNIEAKAAYAGSEAFGAIAAVNSGTVGYEELDYDNYEKGILAFIYAAPTVWVTSNNVDLTITVESESQTVTVCTIPAMATGVIGGVIGINTEDGVVNAVITETHASLVATDKAGGLVGENLGTIGVSTLTTAAGCAVNADIAGGIVGLNAGVIDRVVATLRGAVGNDLASYAGGVYGKNTHSGTSVTNTAVALYADVYGERAGLAAGDTTAPTAINTWVQICNSSRTKAVGADVEATGFNVIRVLNETLLTVNLTERTGRFAFISAISGVKNWYTDISAWTDDSGFISNMTGRKRYESDGLEINVTYYVCYDDLIINNYTEFNDLATKINSHSYYNDVLFRLGEDIMVDAGKVLRPIGTEEYPFNAIFDGALYTVTMDKDSAISGQEYTGLFGYTAPNSVIKSFVFIVEEGASIGSVNSNVIGSLVGFNQGTIKDVFVNLSVNLTYKSDKRSAGVLIGEQAEGAPNQDNVWVSVLNAKDRVVGNMTTSQFGVNQLGVLGNGMTTASIYTVDDKLNELRKRYLAGEDIELSALYTATKGFASFDKGWYKDITKGNGFDSGTITGIGSFVGNGNNKDIRLTTDPEAINSSVTLSFIKLTIGTAEEFAEFAENIKNYGDQGAEFKLTKDIVISYPDVIAVGTPDRPFTGTFDGLGHTITVTGRAIKRAYAGVFGYVGTGGTIKNLLIETGENVRFGDNDALYSGVAVALLYGTINNVVVRVHADTVVYTTQGAPSSGGIVGRAGKLAEDGSVLYNYTIDNCWLIIEENATVTEPMGRQEGAAYPAFYEANGVARKMRMVGSKYVEDIPDETNPFNKGALKVSLTADGEISFNAGNVSSGFYGFIDNTTTDEASMKPISDNPNKLYLWTVRAGNLYGSTVEPKVTSEDMLCVIINKDISNVDDFLMIAENVKKGRNYRGIIYELTADIVITASDLENGVYDPIGGEVKVESGTGFDSYIERDFLGSFNGNWHTITLAADVVIDARYAGLFGRVGEGARIRDLIVKAYCAIGRDSADNTSRTIYAGVLAGYALGGTYNNVAIVLDTNASLFGSVGTGRAFGYLPPDHENNVANNSWVISYNSKANYELGESELSFNKGGEGINQGGFNSLMVIAAGILNVKYNKDDSTFYFTYSDPNAGAGEQSTLSPYWYDRYRDTVATQDDYFHTKTDKVGTWDDTFNMIEEGSEAEIFGYYPSGSEKRRLYNVSFLNSRIESADDLKKYAANVNAGYDFYKLTFTLESDIAIDAGFKSIGTAVNGMNGTFDGNKHTITLPKDISVEGEYAGIFGYVAADGEIVNLRIVVEGTLGKSDYTQDQIDAFKVKNTRYAGAIAYNNGVLRNVIVISDRARLNALNSESVRGVKGLAIAYDATNLLENVWALVDASSYVDAIGVCAVGDTRVNVMTVIGIGVIDANFATDSYKVKFTNELLHYDPEDAGVYIPVMGWYKSFEKNQQISKAMLSSGDDEKSGDLSNGKEGYLLAPIDYTGVNYEVAVIKTTLTEVADLMAIAEDVNVGGYTFENITFNLGADITLSSESDFMPIGSAEHRFKGTFSGKAADGYHVICIAETCVGEFYSAGVFGYNAGTVIDLGVEVCGTVGRAAGTVDNIYGGVVNVNYGTVKRTYVDVKAGGVVTGYTVGGIVGANHGTVSDCLAFVREGGKVLATTTLRNSVNAGALCGNNYGTVEGATDFTYWGEDGRDLLPKDDGRIAKAENGAEANVFIYGSVTARSTAALSAPTNAGGAVGYHSEGYMNYLIVYLADQGTIKSEATGAGSTRAGGFVGYSKAAMNHSVIFLYGSVVAEEYLGGTAGYLDGVIAMNVWQVTLNREAEGAGEGAKTVNYLNIKGNGKVMAAIDLFTKRIIFTNVTEDEGTDLDYWYTAASVQVDEKTGNVGENGNTFLPLSTIQNKHVMVIFVNTRIYSVADLNDMASSVSGGLSGSAIVFTLMNDITVEAGELTTSIGTEEYPFNNIFDGGNYKITLKGGSLVGTDYTALFGYTGATAVIRNLTVEAEAGSYGTPSSLKTAILAAVNEGTISKVTVTVKEGAALYGETVGIVAADNYGVIKDIVLTLNGSVTADAENTAIAGGVVGANDGTMERVSATVGAASSVRAVNAATSYAGVIAGENYKTISVVDVAFQGELSASGSMVSYSGTLAGINLGNVYRVYAEITGATFGGNDKDRSGGLIGNNVNALTTSLVKVVGEVFGGTDSVIGYTKAKDPAKVHNVWVYSDRVENVSSAACVNSMIFDPEWTISCPTAEEVTAGKISFTREITELDDSIALFAGILADGSYQVGSGAAMDNVVYTTADDKSYITYTTYDLEAESAVSRVISDVRVRLVTRSSIGSGSELYAFALALNSGVYHLADATFTLTADFTLPERAFPAMTIPASLTLTGDHHVVTVGNATLDNGFIAENNGIVHRLGLRLTKAETAAYLVKVNNGTVKNAAVYLESDASLAGGEFFTLTDNGTSDNLWVVSRSAVVTTYPVIRINGVGTLTQGGEDGLTFSADPTDDIIFIGYTNKGESGRSIFSAEALFDTAGGCLTEDYFTAEFISKTIDSDYKLQVLSDVTDLGYTGADETFTIGADLIATDTLFKNTLFRGTILGGGHTLKAQGVTGALFENFGGVMQSLVIDLTEGGSVTLFGSDEELTLRDVVILEERDTFLLGDTVTASGVWVVTGNKTLYEALKEANIGHSVLFKNGPVTYSFEEGVKVTAADNDEKVFAGWYNGGGTLIDDIAGKNYTATLPAGAGNAYYLNYIDRTFDCADDLVRLAKAVKNGFEFEGVTFLVQSGELFMDEEVETIGDATHEFKGNIFGSDKSTIVYRNYTENDAFTVQPFLYRVNGEIRNLIFEYRSGATFNGTPALVNENLGMMQGIVVISKSKNLFAGGAGLTLRNNGVIKNAWLVTGGTDQAIAAEEENRVGVNEMRVDDKTVVDIAFSESVGGQGTRVVFHMTAETKNFLSLYGYDGKVVFPGNYYGGYYTAPATSSGVKIAVKSINTIADQDELVYLGHATEEYNLEHGSVITLGADIVVKRNLKSIRFGSLILDLNGHYLDLTASTATKEAIFEKGAKEDAGASGIVRNGAIYLHKECYGIAAEGLTLDNMVIFLCDNGMDLPKYNLSNVVKIVTEDRTRKAAIATLSGSYNYLYAPRAAFTFKDTPELDAAIRASFNLEDDCKMSFVGQENDLYYYGGRDEINGKEEVSYFAAKEIGSADMFIDFIKAAELSEDDEGYDYLKGATILLTSDITVDGSVATGVTFAGTLLGNGHTVTIAGGSFGTSYLKVYADGSVTDLALAFKGATITTEELIYLSDDAADVSGLVLVIYQTSTENKQTDENATVVNVYGDEGAVSVSYEESGVYFIAKDSGNYALREWKKSESLGRENYRILGNEPVSAYFALRYYLTVEYVGVADAVLKSNERDLPVFSGVGVTFADAVVDGKITLTVTDIGKGFLLNAHTGLSSEGEGVNVAMGANAYTYVVTLGTAYDVVVKVPLTYIEMVWQAETYKAGAYEFTAYDSLKDQLTALGYQVDYKYTPLEDTPQPVSNKPYHAGSYLVSFEVYYQIGMDGATRRRVCDASCGFTINKAELTFKSVAIKDKVYDGTTVAERDESVPFILEGFKGTKDADHITVDGLTFAFADANAGEGKLVYVSGDGSLTYKAAEGLTVLEQSIYPYVYRDYDFKAGSIASDNVLIRASIKVRPLEITINSLTVEYLAQFGESAPVLTPAIVETLDEGRGIVEEDRAAFSAAATSLVTRERADEYDVGYYRIIVGDSFSFPNYEVKLQSGVEAYYIVTPSEITVVFEEDTMVYGDKEHMPKYTAYKGEEVLTRCAYDSETPLLFTGVVYNNGNALLPNDEESRYSFTCLFSSENKNYTVKPGTAGYRIVNGKKMAVLSGSGKLLVTPKTLLVTAEAAKNTKRVGVRTDTPTAELVRSYAFVEAGAKLVVSRAAGESVGSYKLLYNVTDENGADITSRYSILPQSGEDYTFTITPVVIRIKPTRTQITYGETLQTVNYGASVEGGGISLADIYWATKWTKDSAPEKANATLADIGVSLTLDSSLTAVLSVGEYKPVFVKTINNANVAEVVTDVKENNKIVVRQRDLTITVRNITKTYDGTDEVSGFRYESTGLLKQDTSYVEIVADKYTVSGKSADIGIYKITGEFSLRNKKSADVAKNYNLIYRQGYLTIEPATVEVEAEIGYFDAEGAFTPATITRGTLDYENMFFYGDAKVTFRYSFADDVDFLEIPDGTDKEVSDFIASTLKIEHYRLNGLLPEFYYVENIGMTAGNNNYLATFSGEFQVEPVRLMIKLLPATKTVGEPDPKLEYVLIAMDEKNDDSIIEDYDKLSEGTFDIVVSAERSAGETLGTYTYGNVVVEIKNLAAGVTLTDEKSESGAAFADRIETSTAEATLSIEQTTFIKTTWGKVLIYGGPILVLAVAVVLMIILIPRARRKRKAAEGEGPDSPDGSDGPDNGPDSSSGGEGAGESELDSESESAADEAAETPAASAEPENAAGASTSVTAGADELFSAEPPASDTSTAVTPAAEAPVTTESPLSDTPVTEDMLSSEPPTAEGADFDASDFDIGPNDDTTRPQ